MRAFLSGSLSATCSTILFQPFDLIKTRIQNDPNKLSVIQVVRHDNLRSLWRGTTPSLVRTVPGIGLYFMSIDFLNGLLARPPSAVEAAFIGVTARGLAGVVLHPMTVVKTRFESGQFKYSSLSRALSDMYYKEGVRGLFKGFTPTVLRDAPYSGLYYMFFSQLKRDDRPVFVCGLSAGLLASLVTQPFDVLKTKMQLQNLNNIYAAAVFVFRSKGVNGFFAGTTPRIMRRSLMSALSWTLFDSLTKAVNQTTK